VLKNAEGAGNPDQVDPRGSLARSSSLSLTRARSRSLSLAVSCSLARCLSQTFAQNLVCAWARLLPVAEVRSLSLAFSHSHAYSCSCYRSCSRVRTCAHRPIVSQTHISRHTRSAHTSVHIPLHKLALGFPTLRTASQRCCPPPSTHSDWNSTSVPALQHSTLAHCDCAL